MLHAHVTAHVTVGRHGRAEHAACSVRERLEVGQLLWRDVRGVALFGRGELHRFLGELLVEVARVSVRHHLRLERRCQLMTSRNEQVSAAGGHAGRDREIENKTKANMRAMLRIVSFL